MHGNTRTLCLIVACVVISLFAQGQVVISPPNASIVEGATQQFTSNPQSTWTADCGSIDFVSGLYTAPLAPGSCTLTASATDGSGATGSAVATVTPPFTITPASATTVASGSQGFLASVQSTWSASCGTISSNGSYTAPWAPATCIITATATTGTHFTAQATDTVTQGVLAVRPHNPTVLQGGTVQFTSNNQASWSTSCGNITANGLFTAPFKNYPWGCRILATATDGSGQTSASTTTVTSPLAVTPATASTLARSTQQFSATQSSTWATTCGTIDGSGLFTAPTTQMRCTITATAATGPPYTAQVVDSIWVPTDTVSPASPTVAEGGTQQFTGTNPSAWSASCGTISSGGLYTAPLVPGPCNIIATATDGSGLTGSTRASVVSPISITPIAATTLINRAQQFTSTVQSNWSATCGAIDANGLFTASGTPATCIVTATAATGISYTAQAKDTVKYPTVSPVMPALLQGSSQTFTFSLPATWSASCGTIDPNSGIYHAPYTVGTCSITALATDGSGATGSTKATINSPITLTPATARTVRNATQQFTASAGVSWSASCGTVDANGLFTAPNSIGSCIVTATATVGPLFTAQATDNVTSGLPINYTTWKYDNQRTGLQPEEAVLTPANVNASHFGPIWHQTLDGAAYAQPLYLNNWDMGNGTKHNLVFFVTENDSVYAFDADNGNAVWQKSLLAQGLTSFPANQVVGSQLKQSGITSTPVIDPVSATMYVVTESYDGLNCFFHLHALNVTTGVEQPGSPVLVTTQGFFAIKHLQRPGLLLANGNVYLGFGSQGEHATYHGWIFAYNAATLGQVAVWNSTPNGQGGAVWMAGAGLSADSVGNIYFATANGDFDNNLKLGQSVVKVSPGLAVLDYFTPFDNYVQSQHDLDLGSGGVLVVPDQPGAVPHLLILCGKPTPIYVLNRDQMSHFNQGTDLIVQRLDGQLGPTPPVETCLSTPAFWNNRLYIEATSDVLKQFYLDPNSGQLSGTPTAMGTYQAGAQVVISANGNDNGIVWTLDGNNSARLRAYDAISLNLLYTSSGIGFGSAFTVPTVVNGHVYVGLGTTAIAYGSY